MSARAPVFVWAFRCGKAATTDFAPGRSDGCAEDEVGMVGEAFELRIVQHSHIEGREVPQPPAAARQAKNR